MEKNKKIITLNSLTFYSNREQLKNNNLDLNNFLYVKERYDLIRNINGTIPKERRGYVEKKYFSENYQFKVLESSSYAVYLDIYNDENKLKKLDTILVQTFVRINENIKDPREDNKREDNKEKIEIQLPKRKKKNKERGLER